MLMPARTPDPETQPNPHAQSLSDLLGHLAGDQGPERISIGGLLETLGDRALAALIFIFAVPNILPTPPGTSALLGAPLILLSAQLCFGMKPWLPKILAQRSMARADFQSLVGRILPWLAKAERLLRPRTELMTRPPMEYLVGGLCLVLSIVLILPIPLGNVLPAFAMSLMALGILERDGVWVAMGMAAGIFALAVIWGVLFAMAKMAALVIGEWIR